MIPFLDLQAQYKAIGPELEAAAIAVMRRGEYVLGSSVTAFEENFAAYCGTGHCVALNTGTSAAAPGAAGARHRAGRRGHHSLYDLRRDRCRRVLRQRHPGHGRYRPRNVDDGRQQARSRNYSTHEGDCAGASARPAG